MSGNLGQVSNPTVPLATQQWWVPGARIQGWIDMCWLRLYGLHHARGVKSRLKKRMRWYQTINRYLYLYLYITPISHLHLPTPYLLICLLAQHALWLKTHSLSHAPSPSPTIAMLVYSFTSSFYPHPYYCPDKHTLTLTPSHTEKLILFIKIPTNWTRMWLSQSVQ